MQSDPWDAVGNLVASSGREFAKKYPQLSKEFKFEVLKLISLFEEKSLKLFISSEN